MNFFESALAVAGSIFSNVPRARADSVVVPSRGSAGTPLGTQPNAPSPRLRVVSHQRKIVLPAEPCLNCRRRAAPAVGYGGRFTSR
jgi:hypothetical protein